MAKIQTLYNLCELDFDCFAKGIKSMEEIINDDIFIDRDTKILQPFENKKKAYEKLATINNSACFIDSGKTIRATIYYVEEVVAEVNDNNEVTIIDYIGCDFAKFDIDLFAEENEEE